MSELETSLIVDRLPYELAARIEANAFFADITVAVAEEGNVAQMVEAKQAIVKTKGGKWGVAVIVLQVPEEEFRPNLQFGPMLMQPEIQVVENVDQNNSASGTGKSYRQVARQLVRLLKGTVLEGLTKQIATRKPAIEPVALAQLPGKNLRGCQVNLECMEASTSPGSQVATPVLSAVAAESGPQVAMACATAGAVIWYTVDDSYPQPSNANTKSTAQVYSGPIAIPEGGFVVRACGYLEGMIESSVPRKTISVDWS